MQSGTRTQLGHFHGGCLALVAYVEQETSQGRVFRIARFLLMYRNGRPSGLNGICTVAPGEVSTWRRQHCMQAGVEAVGVWSRRERRTRIEVA